jgi:hypothetical protein
VNNLREEAVRDESRHLLRGVLPDSKIVAVVTLSKTQEKIEIEMSNAVSTAEGQGWRFIKKVVEI